MMRRTQACGKGDALGRMERGVGRAGGAARRALPARVRVVMMPPASTTPARMEAIAVPKGISRR